MAHIEASGTFFAGDRFFQDQFGLRVRNLSRADNGLYYCCAEVESSGFYDEQIIDVIVDCKFSCLCFWPVTYWCVCPLLQVLCCPPSLELGFSMDASLEKADFSAKYFIHRHVMLFFGIKKIENMLSTRYFFDMYRPRFQCFVKFLFSITIIQFTLDCIIMYI